MDFAKAKEGSIHIFLIALWVIFFVACVIMGGVYANTLMTQMNSLKNKCDFTNLSTYKEISRPELSTNGQTVFSADSLNNVYDTFRQYLQINLNTDGNLNPMNQKSDIHGPYHIHKMIVYSFKDTLLSAYEYDEGAAGFATVMQNSSQTVIAPNGVKVTATSVYTEVCVDIKLVFGYTYPATIVSYTGVTNK